MHRFGGYRQAAPHTTAEDLVITFKRKQLRNSTQMSIYTPKHIHVYDSAIATIDVWHFDCVDTVSRPLSSQITVTHLELLALGISR
jgi:hypothetical protein